MAVRCHVMLVHGAWHGGWAWDPLLPHLLGAGLDVKVVDLPSAGSGGDLAADAAVVRDALRADPWPTVVVGHSYGGIVVSEAAAGEPNVMSVVYLAAFMLDTGESLLGALGGAAPGWIEVDAEAGVSRVPDPVPVFYADLPDVVAQGYASRLSDQSLASFAAPQTAAAWQEVPSVYVACTQDQAIPYAAQRAMSARARAVYTLESSHSPFASHPAEVAGIIAAAAG